MNLNLDQQRRKKANADGSDLAGEALEKGNLQRVKGKTLLVFPSFLIDQKGHQYLHFSKEAQDESLN